MKENKRYSGYLKLDLQCKESKNIEFKLFFSAVITDIDNNTITIDMLNPLEIEKLLKKEKNFYLFIPEEKIVNQFNIIRLQNKICGELTNSFEEKRRVFRLPVCDTDFYIDNKKASLINMSVSGISFEFENPLDNIITLKSSDGKAIKTKIIDIKEKNNLYIHRGKILEANFNISQFLSEEYLSICKRLLKDN